MAVAAGGRVFPGRHQFAHFDVTDEGHEIKISARKVPGEVECKLKATLAENIPESSVFETLAEASDFFQNSNRGFSPCKKTFESLELYTKNWNFQPLEMAELKIRFFDDLPNAMAGAVQFDSAFLMRNIEHEWRTPLPRIEREDGK